MGGGPYSVVNSRRSNSSLQYASERLTDGGTGVSTVPAGGDARHSTDQ